MTQFSQPTPDEIIKLVKGQEEATKDLRQRMQDDYDWYRLHWTDDRQEATADGYQTYRTNEPRTFAKRVISWLTTADMTVRVPLDEMQTMERKQASLLEQFVIGALRAVDKNLTATMMPSLRDLLAFYITVRGRYGGRAMLVKEEDGSTSVNVNPFDPLHTFYGIGGKGLKWCVYRQTRTHDEIEAEYGILVPGSSGGNETGKLGLATYDYYDGQVNGVCTKDTWLKPLAPHYSPSIPIFMGVVGATPPVEAMDGGGDGADKQDAFVDFGESFADENREVWDNFNKTMSDTMTLVRRSVKPPSVFKSRDGAKVPSSDPYREGSVVSLRLEEEFKSMELLKMSLDTGPFMAQVSGEMQRGSIPHSVYGDLQFQLSGFAINTLRQGVDASVAPRIVAKESALSQIARLLVIQYATGGFASLTLSGRGMDRRFFKRVFLPTDVDPNAHIEITLAAKLPQDEMQRFAMAQIAREGKTPLLSGRTTRDTILKIQDVDAEEDIIREEIAEVASPTAMLYSLIQSAQERGRPDLVAIYGQELQELLMQKAIARQAAMMGLGGAPPTNGGSPQPGPASVPGTPPEVMPNAMMGQPPPAPTPQGGPNVPPNTPRPGAQGQ